MALVNGGFLHCMDMKKFIKNLLQSSWSDFEIILQECLSGDPFKKLLVKFCPFINMALLNGGFVHYADMKKFIKKSSSQKLLVRF